MKGFTLVELVIVIAIISLISVITITGYYIWKTQNELDIAQILIVNSFKRAQLMAESVSNDSGWGINLQTGKATVFEGDTYLTRNTSSDINIDLPQSISYSGLNEVVFSKVFGIPSITGAVLLTRGDKTRQIVINAKGVLNY